MYKTPLERLLKEPVKMLNAFYGAGCEGHKTLEDRFLALLLVARDMQIYLRGEQYYDTDSVNNEVIKWTQK